ncbi:unnamed protein product [Colias eurytheme]|nr:unnamed protein product [Colias eurytheme]
MDVNNTPWPRKRPRKVKKAEAIKEKKLKGEEHVNHVGKLIPAVEVGPDCKCERYKCFQNISEENRKQILADFRNIPSKNLQDAHLSGLITVEAVKQRRSRKATNMQSGNEFNVTNHDAAFYYKVRTKKDETFVDQVVCAKAFYSLHGIGRNRVRRLQKFLTESTVAPIDQRGKHTNRPKMLPLPLKHLIVEHIKSFKARQSHYSIRKNPNRLYLPETLSINKMHNLFIDQFKIRVPYKAYWSIFTTEFNIKFGVPRSDTCTACDQFRIKLESRLDESEKNKIITEKNLHLLKAEKFYELKRLWKQRAREGQVTVISFDFMQNLPLPHIPTNTVFYCRQLWYYVFGLHDLSNDDASLYCYHEGVGKKGQNDVTSFLFQYLTHKDVKQKLVLFSDGCSGQNKNYVMVHFLYMLVHCLHIFDSITYIFPIRGHSFLPNDQDFAIIEKRKRKEQAETPSDWDSIMSGCRQSPSPFNVIKVDQSMLFDIKKATEPYFLKSPKPAVQLKNLRMYKINKESPFLFVRDHYSGPWRSCIIRNKKKMPQDMTLSPIYTKPIPINTAKLNDLQKLVPFLKESNQQFYSTLNTTDDDVSADVDNSDNSSGEE